MNEGVASTALLSLTSSIAIFNSLCPPLHEVRRATPADSGVVNDVRVAEIASVSLAIAIGITGSGLTKSPLPAMLSIVAAGALVVMYESVLRTPPIESKGTVK